MENYSENTILIIGIAVSLLMLIIAVFILLFFLAYQKKHNSFIMEKRQMETIFQQNLLQSRVEIQEQTFNNISQEIHDNVGQILSVAKLQLNILGENEVLDKQLLKEARENISTAMTDLRDIAKSLSGNKLQSIPLHELIDKEIAGLGKTGILKGQLTVTGTQKEIDNSKKLILFRIVQECLQNIIKHASASRVRIAFSYKADKLEIVIQDNGKGFNTAVKQNTGLGLQNIMNRAALIGGAAVIESEPGEGTKISITGTYG
jgi:signal transduction histidine kinase